MGNIETIKELEEKFNILLQANREDIKEVETTIKKLQKEKSHLQIQLRKKTKAMNLLLDKKIVSRKPKKIVKKDNVEDIK